jgi:hypothetical protein
MTMPPATRILISEVLTALRELPPDATITSRELAASLLRTPSEIVQALGLLGTQASNSSEHVVRNLLEAARLCR